MAKPLLNIHCIYDKNCKYPTGIRVAMDDGSVQTYLLKVDQNPNFVEAMNALERMFDCFQVTGYKYEPRKRKYRRSR